MDFLTGHTDHVNDVQLDYYGRRVATASSDQTIRIFDVASESATLLAELKGHSAPVWQVAWAHPKYGSLVASCSYDSTVIVWKESDAGWMQIFQSSPAAHSASVNGLSWASHETGLILASASSDGSVCVYEYQSDGTWTENKVPDVDAISCTSISWACASLSGSLAEEDSSGTSSSLRFAVGGCEGLIKILSMANEGWRIEKKLIGHENWVLDVAWAPSMTSSRNCIASASKDCKVIVWKEKSTGMWEQHIVNEFDVPVFRVRWSVTGSVLSVADANQNITLWKESPALGKWTRITS